MFIVHTITWNSCLHVTPYLVSSDLCVCSSRLSKGIYSFGKFWAFFAFTHTAKIFAESCCKLFRRHIYLNGGSNIPVKSGIAQCENSHYSEEWIEINVLNEADNYTLFDN